MGNVKSAMRAFDPQKASKVELKVFVMARRRNIFDLLKPCFDLAEIGYGLLKPQAALVSWNLMNARRASANMGHLQKFYDQLKRAFPAEPFDPTRAATLEMASRQAQNRAEVITDWYAELYRSPRDLLGQAAFYRAEALGHFDRWQKEGARFESAILKQMEAELFKNWAALRAAVADW